ncbi:MAG: hypothetical protein IKT31_01685, partial [Firmicutes bacterium]|nr:hypothetical protein [Bacillota bacterium]
AYLVDSSDVVKNTFTAGEVPNEVVEEIENNVKNNVAIANTGTVDAYARAAVVVNWLDADGNVSSKKPAEGADYSMNWRGLSDGWVKGADGYYYYTQPVAPNNGVTSVLFTGCAPLASPEGLKLSVEIMAQTIQADGMDGSTPVVVEVWGPKENGSVVSVADNGTLTIQQ